MNTLQWLTTETLSLIGSFTWNFIKGGFLAGLLGFVIGVFLVFFLRRKGLMKRPNSLWKLIVKLQYIFIPILLAFIFGSVGATNSVHTMINQWVDNSTLELNEYSKNYVPEIQLISERLSTSATNTDGKVKELILESSGLAENAMAQNFYYAVNRQIIGYSLEYLGLANNVEGLKELSKPENASKLSEISFSSLSKYLKSSLIGPYVSGFYWSIAIFFIPFLLISLGEFVLFFINRRAAPVIRKSYENARDKYTKNSEGKNNEEEYV